ncbi:hypothetical protein HK405_007215, partial [Cladochytrium tenue]
PLRTASVRPTFWSSTTTWTVPLAPSRSRSRQAPRPTGTTACGRCRQPWRRPPSRASASGLAARPPATKPRCVPLCWGGGQTTSATCCPRPLGRPECALSGTGSRGWGN